MKRILFFLLLPIALASCDDDWAGTVIKYPNVYYVGDSLCTPNSHFLTAQQQVGIRSTCIWGLTMQNSGPLPTTPQASLVFLALGSNDALLNYDPFYYGQQIQEKLTKTNAVVYCVPPIPTPNLNATAFRNKMLAICDHVLDPLEFGVDVMDGDMQHWDATDHANFVDGLIAILTVEGFIEQPPTE